MKDFKLETILTIMTGINLTDNFNDVYEFAYYIFDDPNISSTGIAYLKNKMIEHILAVHPELKIGYVPCSSIAREKWLMMLKQKYGVFLSIPKINNDIIIKNKTR